MRESKLSPITTSFSGRDNLLYRYDWYIR